MTTMLAPLIGFTRRAPLGSAVALRCFSSLERGPRTRVVTGIPTNDDRAAVATLMLVSPAQCTQWNAHGFSALFEGKSEPAAYVCESFLCELPQRRTPRKD
ncbi:hypothetical protein [Humidisolicoccus flavus]|uniref:hypothetical protein n=1 Tax=Humidisolicoccus flavus TaxID=3111414 RepID=UPI00325517B8